MYAEIFGGLVVTCALVRFAQYYFSDASPASDAAKPSDGPAANTPDFRAFQNNYLLVYLLAIAADWLQGPYVYALYAEYGYGKKEIAQLFIAGFGSSAVFGTFIGSIADKYGRKFNVLVFVITYALSCMTKHSPNFATLMVGRLLAGIATSILFSAFESWLVSEHNNRGFDPNLIADTFSKAQFGNAVVAIVAGQIAGIVAAQFGKVAPFDTAAVVLAATGLIVMLSWSENFGDSRQTVTGGLRSAWHMMIADEKILLVGIIQSCFESAMYLMVFSWTPALQAASNAMSLGEIPHGMIFSSFMVCIMIGSSLFVFLMKTQPAELFMRNMYIIGVVCFVVTTISSNVWEVYGALLAFEVICGLYFPAMGTMRAKYVPEVTRSAIMNYFRLPLNLIVCLILYKNYENTTVFCLCAVMMAIAVICQQRLFSASKVSIGTKDEWTREERAELVEEGDSTVEDAVR
ncbi:unnamed protein product [Chondrus crispus]|uniref:Molybdate-anion transporter n=1 Tax=Chondrus crispus TaxID=2769 RepID=R7QTD5_CHOCR|nr:unnamed protein product [Chondrus crispus]CDF41384.1 unnamed protein product [Chondrus crispus]|eukprot:XP_005711678.1 unnamed protein product [Chondrus crispus]